MFVRINSFLGSFVTLPTNSYHIFTAQGPSLRYWDKKTGAALCWLKDPRLKSMPSFSARNLEIMEGSSVNSSAKKPSELEALQNKLEGRTRRIEELKSQIESLKFHLEEKKKKSKDVLEEKKEAFKDLCEKYNSLSKEYISLLAEKSKE